VACVATDLQEARLPVHFKLEGATEGWQVFSITFDPARVSSERIEQVVAAAGGRIIPAPVGR
jgi:hypothetical protein